ncbi:hypothetical protein ACFSKI_11280 [Pseudogracilibacillus auburnensis]|uniref:Uncharacterized protein n=1 Tax=Pseudogracilibacillus auburnensis TaxID=1494959 RepID=A0A2V3W3P2_9BACI|nr:hypothetical protein [Pseudogracilibacillus auburnensis]MBO1001865.1 hypothetical protein [Pseudogracilibacillus auburnensis]PXW83349.1 hypothetical protein DFR56_11628 [Pseudogracilibacillus auburnensis]
MNQGKASSPVVLNRNKSSETQFIEKLKKVEEETTNSALAIQFPDWDLTPPTTLLKRKRSKLL